MRFPEEAMHINVKGGESPRKEQGKCATLLAPFSQNVILKKAIQILFDHRSFLIMLISFVSIIISTGNQARISPWAGSIASESLFGYNLDFTDTWTCNCYTAASEVKTIKITIALAAVETIFFLAFFGFVFRYESAPYASLGFCMQSLNIRKHKLYKAILVIYCVYVAVGFAVGIYYLNSINSFSDLPTLILGIATVYISVQELWGSNPVKWTVNQEMERIETNLGVLHSCANMLELIGDGLLDYKLTGATKTLENALVNPSEVPQVEEAYRNYKQLLSSVGVSTSSIN